MIKAERNYGKKESSLIWKMTLDITAEVRHKIEGTNIHSDNSPENILTLPIQDPDISKILVLQLYFNLLKTNSSQKPSLRLLSTLAVSCMGSISEWTLKKKKKNLNSYFQPFSRQTKSDSFILSKKY